MLDRNEKLEQSGFSAISILMPTEMAQKFHEKTKGFETLILLDYIRRVNSGDIPPEEYHNAGRD